MSSKRRSVLSAGLGRFASLDPNGQAQFGPDAGKRARELLAISIEKASEAGFDIVTVDINSMHSRWFARYQLKDSLTMS